MPKEPDDLLTKSAIEAEMNRISREFTFDAAAGQGKNLDRLLEDMRRLVEHVKHNKKKIADDSS